MWWWTVGVHHVRPLSKFSQCFITKRGTVFVISLYNIFIVLDSVFIYQGFITQFFNVFWLPYIFLWLQKEDRREVVDLPVYIKCSFPFLHLCPKHEYPWQVTVGTLFNVKTNFFKITWTFTYSNICQKQLELTTCFYLFIQIGYCFSF